jgi:hypothetical protein
MNAKFKKPLLVAGVASSVALASITGAGVVSAATNTNPSADGANSLVDKIATKFHLNKTDVKAVFDEDRATHEADRQKANEARLDQAVKDGKITSDQKALILSKQAEMKTEMKADHASTGDKTGAERKAEMDTKRAEIEKWATDNNIPVEYLHPGGGHGGPHGPGGPGERGEM